MILLHSTIPMIFSSIQCLACCIFILPYGSLESTVHIPDFFTAHLLVDLRLTAYLGYCEQYT